MQPLNVETVAKQGFQSAETALFSTKTTQKRRLKRRNTPIYRLNRIYSKSVKQYQSERNRRRQVMKLSSEGKSTRAIAESLGVSTRTILRDKEKVTPYVIGQIRKGRHLLEEQQQRELDAATAKIPLEEYFKRLTDLMCKTRKLSKKEEYEQHNKTMTINLDDTINGFPKISFSGSMDNSTVKFPYRLEFVFVKDGVSHDIGGITYS